ncbi:MAG: hypothetical protein JOS17DRAFT_820495 [Linnemannia elongata]|nr:MAG: hypothetical protein JOS17DRAFT_820495 [Linnemannia elongata]
MLQVDITQEHVQGFRSVHKSQPPSTISVPLNSPEVIHIDCYTDPDTNKDYILWEDIQQAFNEAMSVRNRTKMVPFAKGKDLRALEPRRIPAVPNVVLDVVVGGELTASEVTLMKRNVQDLSLSTPPQSSSSSVRRNSDYGDILEALQNYNHKDFPTSVSHLRGPQMVYDEYKDNSSNAPTVQDYQSETVTKNLLNPQDYDAAANMGLMKTMVCADHGDAHAQVALGDRFKDGRQVYQDHQAAMGWYIKAADQNHPRAQYGIGLLYEQGEDGVPQDHSKAFEWFHKAALQGYADAQAKVSHVHTKGAGVPKDNIEAMEWMVKAAENGHAGTQYNMGAAYEKGLGVPQSDSKAFEWYLKSADQEYAEAQARVASAFEVGWGVSQDDAKAIEWYTKAADHGLAVAQFALGRVHKLGLCGLPKDQSKAVDWYFKAAVQGHTEAQSMLREIYNRSTSSSDPDFALDLATQSKIKGWFMNTAGQGVAHAQCCMAYMYADGRGVDKDEFKAFEWYLKAAEQGDERAQIRVALWYGSGIGVTKSTTRGLVQGLRSVHKGLPPSTTSAPLDTPDVVHIDCYTDPDTLEDFILWDEIQQAFDGALCVRHKSKMLPFVKGKDYRALEPLRIAAVPGLVLDVVVGDKLVVAAETATADMTASLQRAVQELLLNMPRQTPIESATYNPSLLQGSQAPEWHSQESNKGVLDTKRPEANSKPTKRLDDPQDGTAAKNMTLMQTMVHANQGNIHAQVALGDRFRDGREVHQDRQAAMDWYCKAAGQGHPRGQYGIGLLYDQGYGSVPQDHAMAFESFLKAALQGYSDAQAKVSQAYTNGAGISKDNIKAMEWSIKAAENGHAERQHYMGAAYEKGLGVPQSDSRSFEWYLKSANQGFVEAQERVAAAFEAGRGVQEDGPKAVKWYTKAADRGLPVAQFALGRVHKLGFCGLPKDRSKAVGWFIKAAVQGHTEAQSMLREIYDPSTSSSDPNFALDLGTQSKIKKWFMKAAEQGVAHAQCCMADMYLVGRGVKKDDSKAFEWYLKAAEQGDEAAQRRVTCWYYSGIGVSKSREKCIQWYLRITNTGYGSIDQLGHLLLKK